MLAMRDPSWLGVGWLMWGTGRGVYVPDDERWPEHFRGLGIRIEDSVCVGEENPLVLTTEAVKEVCGLCPVWPDQEERVAKCDGDARLSISKL